MLHYSKASFNLKKSICCHNDYIQRIDSLELSNINHKRNFWVQSGFSKKSLTNPKNFSPRFFRSQSPISTLRNPQRKSFLIPKYVLTNWPRYLLRTANRKSLIVAYHLYLFDNPHASRLNRQIQQVIHFIPSLTMRFLLSVIFVLLNDFY